MNDFREPMFNRRGKPQIIRRVQRWSKMTDPATGKRYPKVAVDRKRDIRMERVKARGSRPCTARDCERDGFIVNGEEYAKVLTPRSPTGAFVRGRRIPIPQDYHFDCVPEEARPLVRFFRPKPKVAEPTC